MFEPSLKAKLTRIFGLDKVTFDTPGESQEQEGMFISVDSAKMRIRDKRQIARVTGTIRVFASLDKMPFGFFSKSLANAAADDVKGLFFYDFEENKGTFRNIAERSMGFIYLFDSQYDPNLGILNEINLTYAENE